MQNSESTNKTTTPSSSSKKKLLSSQFLYGLLFFILFIFAATWIIHDEWTEPHEKKTSSPYEITSKVEKKESVATEQQPFKTSDDSLRKVTISDLDKRMDRLEGLVSEVGSFEQDIDTVKFSLKTLSSRVASLQEKIKLISVHKNIANKKAHDKKNAEMKIEKLASTIKTNNAALNEKLNQMKASRKKQTTRAALVILAVKAFNSSKQALYTGASWYAPIQNLSVYIASFPEKTASDLKILLEKLSLYKKKSISTPTVLRQEFLEILPTLQKNKNAEYEKKEKKSYWSYVKNIFKNLISIKKTRKKPTSDDLPYWEKMQASLNQQQVSQALTVVRLKGITTPLLQKWIDKAEDWVALKTLLTAGEETILQTLLKQES